MLFNKLSENCKNFFSMFDRREWAVIGTLMVANFVNTITFNCMDAFYPKEAHNRNIGTADIGIIIGTYQLSRFLMAPFAGKYIMRIGPTFAFFGGLFITAATAFGFGLLTLLPTGASFFWASLGIRIFQALARTCFVVSSLTITAQLFPDHISLLGGLLETFAGVGYISGPVIGSALFELGGFIVPNFTMGTLMALMGIAFACSTMLTRRDWKNSGNSNDRSAPASRIHSRCPSGSWKGTLRLKHCPNGEVESPYISSEAGGQQVEDSAEENDLESSENSSKISMEETVVKVTRKLSAINKKGKKKEQQQSKSKSSAGLLSVLRHGDTWLIMFVITLRGITCSFYQAPLPEHLSSLSPSALLVGAVYTVMSVSYFLSAPIWGILVEKLKCRQSATTLVTLAGSLLAIGSTLLMGPFPGLPLVDKSIAWMAVSFALLGFAGAALYIPVFQQCAIISKREAETEESDTPNTQVYACLFGLVQSSSTLGSFAGNILGGFGAQQVGFPWTCAIVSLSHLIFVIALSVHSLLFTSSSALNKT